MNWQQAVSLFIVAVAVTYLVWSRIRRPRFSFSRDTHCGCSMVRREGASSSIVYRARKGFPREIHVKMK